MENLIYAYQVKDKDSSFIFAKRGNQVKSLNELVTVNRKYAFRIHCITSKYARRKGYVMICESGNLPGVRCAPDTA